MRKGTFGYIKSKRKTAAIRSFILITLCFSLFFFGLSTTGTHRNVFSVLAAVSCLPMGISVVNYAVFMKARPCSKKAFDAIEQRRGGLMIYYDLMMTGDPHNFPMSAVTTLENRIVCLTEDDKMSFPEAERHIRRQIALSKYHDFRITVTDELELFLTALDELNDLRIEHEIDPQAIEDAWLPGTVQTVAGILLSISI